MITKNDYFAFRVETHILQKVEAVLAYYGHVLTLNALDESLRGQGILIAWVEDDLIAEYRQVFGIPDEDELTDEQRQECLSVGRQVHLEDGEYGIGDSIYNAMSELKEEKEVKNDTGTV